MKTGEKIRLIREIKQISAKQMADDLDMSLSGYQKIERGDVKLNTEKLEEIAKQLGVDSKDLLDSSNITFHITNNAQSTNGYHNTINFPAELKQLYEDKIRLLEDKVFYLEEENRRLKGK